MLAALQLIHQVRHQQLAERDAAVSAPMSAEDRSEIAALLGWLTSWQPLPPPAELAVVALLPSLSGWPNGLQIQLLRDPPHASQFLFGTPALTGATAPPLLVRQHALPADRWLLGQSGQATHWYDVGLTPVFTALREGLDQHPQGWLVLAQLLQSSALKPPPRDPHSNRALEQQLRQQVTAFLQKLCIADAAAVAPHPRHPLDPPADPAHLGLTATPTQHPIPRERLQPPTWPTESPASDRARIPQRNPGERSTTRAKRSQRTRATATRLSETCPAEAPLQHGGAAVSTTQVAALARPRGQPRDVATQTSGLPPPERHVSSISVWLTSASHGRVRISARTIGPEVMATVSDPQAVTALWSRQAGAVVPDDTQPPRQADAVAPDARPPTPAFSTIGTIGAPPETDPSDTPALDDDELWRHRDDLIDYWIAESNAGWPGDVLELVERPLEAGLEMGLAMPIEDADTAARPATARDGGLRQDQAPGPASAISAPPDRS